MQTNGKQRPKRLRTIGALFLLMSVSACETSGITTGIETVAPDASSTSTKTERLSLCDIISRDELRYSRRDTEETKQQLDGVLVKYDATCLGAGS